MLRPWQFSCLLDKHATTSIHAQLIEHFKQSIEKGHWQPSTPLPSTREVANALQINRKTVTRVYEELSALGYIVTEPKRGSFVHRKPPHQLTQVTPPPFGRQTLSSVMHATEECLHDRIQRLSVQSIRRMALHLHKIQTSDYDAAGLHRLKQMLATQLSFEFGLMVRETEIIFGSAKSLESGTIAGLVARGGYLLMDPYVPLATQQRCEQAGICVLRLPDLVLQPAHRQLPLLIEQIEKCCINYPVTAIWCYSHHLLTHTVRTDRWQALAQKLADYQLWCIDDHRDRLPISPPFSAYYAQMSVFLGSLYGAWCDRFNLYYAALPNAQVPFLLDHLETDGLATSLLNMLAQTDLIKRGEYKKLVQAIKHATIKAVPNTHDVAPNHLSVTQIQRSIG